MYTKEEVEKAQKHLDMLEDALKLHSLVQRLLVAFFKQMERIAEEDSKKGGGSGEGNLH